MIPLLILIAGLIAYFATSYDTVGVILMIVGGVLVAVQALFMILAARMASSALRNTNSVFDELNRRNRVRRP